MSEEKKVVETVPAVKFDAKAASASLDANPSAINQLLIAVLAREARAAAKEEAEEHRKKVRSDKHDQNAKHTSKADLDRQARCKHMKGGRRGPKNGNKDFAVGYHTFVNQESQVKCHLCGMKWKIDDTVEFLFRKGKKIKNHTRIGWLEAVGMAQQSTNTATSSEIPMTGMVRQVSDTGETEEQVEYEM